MVISTEISVGTSFQSMADSSRYALYLLLYVHEWPASELSVMTTLAHAPNTVAKNGLVLVSCFRNLLFLVLLNADFNRFTDTASNNRMINK